jgi:hypothetical protein
MAYSRFYDTVAFDVRDNATMLFFANTTDDGEIGEYLLLMRAIEEDFDETLYIEVAEKQVSGHDLVRESRLEGNTLTLLLNEPSPLLGGESEIVLAFAGTESNLSNLETGAFRVLGDSLAGGNA